MGHEGEIGPVKYRIYNDEDTKRHQVDVIIGNGDRPNFVVPIVDPCHLEPLLNPDNLGSAKPENRPLHSFLAFVGQQLHRATVKDDDVVHVQKMESSGDACTIDPDNPYMKSFSDFARLKAFDAPLESYLASKGHFPMNVGDDEWITVPTMSQKRVNRQTRVPKVLKAHREYRQRQKPVQKKVTFSMEAATEGDDEEWEDELPRARKNPSYFVQYHVKTGTPIPADHGRNLAKEIRKTRDYLVGLSREEQEQFQKQWPAIVGNIKDSLDFKDALNLVLGDGHHRSSSSSTAAKRSKKH